MSRLREELGVIPRKGFLIALLGAGVSGALIVALVEEPLRFRLIMGSGMAGVLFIYIGLVAYVYADSRRRGMRHVLWTLVVTFVPNAVGFIAYFLMRESVLTPCGACGAPARREFAFCPQCGAALPRVCPSCRRPVETHWSHCAHCGGRLAPESASAAQMPHSG